MSSRGQQHLAAFSSISMYLLKMICKEPTFLWPLGCMGLDVCGEKSPFSLSLYRMISVHGHEDWLVDCVFVRYWTIHVVSVLNCILSYTVLKCFKQRQSIENTCFYLKGGRGGQKMISFRHSRHLGKSPFSPATIGGGGGGVKFIL